MPIIHHNIQCQKCSYNLRGLSEDGACPECGANVRWTLDSIAHAGRLNKRSMMKRWSILLGAIHLGLVTLLLFAGAGGVWLALYLDFPLCYAIHLIANPFAGWWIIPTCLVGGTLMYAGLGAIIGLAVFRYKSRT